MIFTIAVSALPTVKPALVLESSAVNCSCCSATSSFTIGTGVEIDIVPAGKVSVMLIPVKSGPSAHT